MKIKLDYDALFDIVLNQMDDDGRIWCDEVCEAIEKNIDKIITDVEIG